MFDLKDFSKDTPRRIRVYETAKEYGDKWLDHEKEVFILWMPRSAPLTNFDFTVEHRTHVFGLHSTLLDAAQYVSLLRTVRMGRTVQAVQALEVTGIYTVDNISAEHFYHAAQVAGMNPVEFMSGSGKYTGTALQQHVFEWALSIIDIEHRLRTGLPISRIK